MGNVSYTRGKAVIGGPNGWSVGTYRVLLAASSYTPDPLAHRFVSDVSGELSGGGYLRQTLAGLVVAADDVLGRADFRANAVTFSPLSSTQTYRWVIIYRFATTDADSELLYALDMGPGGIGLTGITSHTLQWDNQPVSGRVFSLS